ncbi:MAG: glutamate formimidoyltransferase [Bacteroidetes bacterium]|nr:glutamate formimidoyltransferase [Bacteroidota bacterium]
MKRIIECVPNISEGRDRQKIDAITSVIETVEGVRLLDVDPGKATNRTVITFAGEPVAVCEAAFRLIAKAAGTLDMSTHQGEHPRMGATDVCPLVPISGITMEETAEFARKLGKRVGDELKIPVYLYEYAASEQYRKNLADIRTGEYEALEKKLSDPQWKPDFGPSDFNEHVKQAGATVIGARDFLVAYNVNLNTTSVRKANSVAFDIREKGRVKRKGDPVTGEIVKDGKGEPVWIPGSLRAVKAIGWFIEEYGIAQISINLTNLNTTPLHIAFDECCTKAQERGLRVTGSEIVGLVPLNSMTEAGKYFLKKQNRSAGASENELIKSAILSLGLNDLFPFKPNEKIIEYRLSPMNNKSLITRTVSDFIDEVSSESPAPGGGSAAALLGSLAAALAAMVANLSSQKRGWENRWEEFSGWAEKAQGIKSELLKLVDEDARAFTKVMDAFGLPKNTPEEKTTRDAAIETASVHAAEIPFRVMKYSFDSFAIIKAMAEQGNPNSISDAGVAAKCAGSAVNSAYLNVLINAKGLKDRNKAGKLVSEGGKITEESDKMENEIMDFIIEKLK